MFVKICATIIQSSIYIIICLANANNFLVSFLVFVKHPQSNHNLIKNQKPTSLHSLQRFSLPIIFTSSSFSFFFVRSRSLSLVISSPLHSDISPTTKTQKLETDAWGKWEWIEKQGSNEEWKIIGQRRLECCWLILLFEVCFAVTYECK